MLPASLPRLVLARDEPRDETDPAAEQSASSGRARHHSLLGGAVSGASVLSDGRAGTPMNARGVVGSLAASAGAALAWGHFEAGWVRLRTLPTPVRALPAELEGVRIAHLSDFHLGVPSPAPSASPTGTATSGSCSATTPA